MFCFTCCSAAGPEAHVQSHRPAASTRAVAASAAEAPLEPSAGPGLPGVGTASALGPSPASGLGQLAPARLPRVARPGGRVLGALLGGLPRAVLRPCVRMSPAPARGSSQHRAAGAPGGLASEPWSGAGLAGAVRTQRPEVPGVRPPRPCVLSGRFPLRCVQCWVFTPKPRLPVPSLCSAPAGRETCSAPPSAFCRALCSRPHADRAVLLRRPFCRVHQDPPCALRTPGGP